VNTERLLNVSVFLRSIHTISGRWHKRQIPTLCSQHRGLAYDDLQEGDGDLTDFGSTRKDLIGAPADVSASVHRLLVQSVTAQRRTRKKHNKKEAMLTCRSLSSA